MILASGHAEVKRLLNQIFEEKDTDKLDQLHQELINCLVNGETMAKMKELCLFSVGRALDSLNLFPNSEAKEALMNIANSCTI